VLRQHLHRLFRADAGIDAALQAVKEAGKGFFLFRLGINQERDALNLIVR
jgi:hypothetical protein